MNTSKYKDLIHPLSDNRVVALTEINEDTINYCIKNYYFKEFGDTFIIEMLITPFDKYIELCKRLSKELGINIECRKMQLNKKER